MYSVSITLPSQQLYNKFWYLILQAFLLCCTSSKLPWWGRDLQDGGGVRHGDHLPHHKYIRNTSTCGTTPTEHLLSTGRRPQTSQKLCGWQGLHVLAECQACASEWESQAQDTGPPETSQPHVISNGKSPPTDLHLNAKTQLHSTTSKVQCWTSYAKQLARQEHNPIHYQGGFLKS